MQTHSPAPWETSRDAVPAGHVQVTVYDKDGNRVATVFQNEGNVALVKAAPDMLEALRYVNGKFGHKFNTDDENIVCAAIAKAEGN